LEITGIMKRKKLPFKRSPHKECPMQVKSSSFDKK
jgi:hypothetical protein